jgi:hypothetical protein
MSLRRLYFTVSLIYAPTVSIVLRSGKFAGHVIILFLRRHPRHRARVQHRLIQELKKIAKTFRIFLALQICFVLLVYSKIIVDFISVIILA